MSDSEYYLLCLTSFIALVNPLGSVPAFLALSDGYTSNERKRAAGQATMTLFFGIMLFAYLGQYIFQLFAITVDALRIVGGLLLLDMGHDLLHGKPPRMKSAATRTDPNMGFVPLGFPVLLGAGAITMSMVRIEQAAGIEQQLLFGAAALSISLIILITLRSADGIARRIGANGQSVINRIMGLLTMIIAVEFIFAGMRPVLIDIGKAIMQP